MGQSDGVRPTKRCLDELGIAPPAADVRLQSLGERPIPEAQAQPDVFEAGGGERIVSLKDRVWFKLKTGRWRGAVVRLTDADLAPESDAHGDAALQRRDRWWLGAAGTREDGSLRDFYEQVASESRCAKTSNKPHGVNTDHLLPRMWDRQRLLLENAYRQRLIYEKVMVEAAARSLRSGKVITAQFSAYSMGVVIRADRGEQCVAFIAEEVFDVRVLAVMLDAFPGISNDDWAPEPGGFFGLQPEPGQIIHSAVLPSEVADAILERVPPTEE